ncbi:MAG TPA: hypothetical protein VMX16_12285 [Terriglobia bacterium]|nr:hypothetical protein [Terriglobia bacterium]
MRKNFLNVFALFCLLAPVSCQVFAGPVPRTETLPRQPTFAISGLSTAGTLTIPAETQVSIELLSGIQSQVSHPDDVVEARLLKEVSVDGRVALPQGTLFTGRVLGVRHARRLHRPAEIAFRFEQIALPDGQEKPFGATISGLQGVIQKNVGLDAEGDLLGRPSLPWKGVALGFAGLGTSVALKAAMVGSSTLLPVVSAGSSAWLAYEFLWRRGREVNVPPQTRCTIRLESPLSVQVSD